MRKFERYAVSLPLVFQELDDVSGKGMAKNVSLSGCFVESEVLPPIKSYLKIEIEIPAFGKILVGGIVLRIEKSGFSVHFNWFDKESLRNLSWFLFHLYPTNGIVSLDTPEPVANPALDDGVVDQLFRKSWASLIERSPSDYFDKVVEWSSHLFTPAAEFDEANSFKQSGFLGTSLQMKEIQKKIRRFSATPLPVLLTGETGVGKEMYARMIHDMSPNHNGPFVPVNCGAIPDTLFESLVFGHEKGSFTGAHSQQQGWLETSRGGTLFLDEIGEIPLPSQVKFLRVLQEKTFTRLGSSREIPFESRVIAATNKNLKEEVRKGHFREDLFYRIEGLLIEIPPLRERLEDIIPLAEYFFCVISRELKAENKIFPQCVKQQLINYSWPGNVRELQNAIYRAIVVSEKTDIAFSDLGLPMPADQSTHGSFRDMVSDFEKKTLTQYLVLCNGNVSKVSETLKISRPSIYNMMRKYKITN
jgi:transcriptional regulator with PAS, ATPase and Fis domain